MRDCYEGYALYLFLALMVAYLGDGDEYKVVELLEGQNSYHGLYFYLGARIATSEVRIVTPHPPAHPPPCTPHTPPTPATTPTTPGCMHGLDRAGMR